MPVIKICGRELDNIMNASGSWCETSEDMNDLVEELGLKTIVAKTCSIDHSAGNKSPRYTYTNEYRAGINCMGLPNLGYKYYRNLLAYYNKRDKTYILSVDGSNIKNLLAMLKDYDGLATKSELVEINLSCPNLSSPTDGQIPSQLISYNLIVLNATIAAIGQLKLQHLIIGYKLAPYVDNYLLYQAIIIFNKFHAINQRLVGYVVMSNTIPNALPVNSKGEPLLSNITGGISGYPVKLIAMSNIYWGRKWLKQSIVIIGCGGIETQADIDNYLKMGALAIQYGSLFIQHHFRVTAASDKSTISLSDPYVILI